MRFLLVALSLALPLTAHGQDTPVRRFALVVGVSSGGPSRTPLRYATSDAEAFAQVLSALGGVAAADKVVLVNPGRTQFDMALADMQTRMADRGNASRVELIVYFSGHSDENGLMLGAEQLSYQSFRAALATLPADVRIAIVDSCQSGALTRRKGGTMRPPFLLDTSSKVQGQAILTSSSETEAAQESDRIKGSFFTHYLISGLRGAADVTRDRRVTLNEAYQFAFAETLARTEGTQYGPQHPAYEIQLTGTGDVVMTDLRATTASLTIDEPLAGRVFLRDKNGVLVAELFKVEGRAVEIGLEPGVYNVRVEKKDEILEGTVEVGVNASAKLFRSSLSQGRVEVAARRGGEERVEGVATAETKRQVTHPISFSLVPDLTLPTTPDDVVLTKNLSIELIYGVTDHLRGLALSLGATRAKQSMRGLQMSLVLNFTGGDSEGIQVSSIMNIADGEMRGIQIGAIANRDRGVFSGIEVASAVNWNSGPTTGLQLAAGVNIADDVLGLQVAPVNIAGDVAGMQYGMVGVGDDVQGAQIALVNVGGDVRGVQLGLVNVGQVVTGAQIGLVNVSKEMHGVPFGLFSYIRNRGLGGDVGASTNEPLQLALRYDTGGVFYGFLGGGIFAFDRMARGDAYLGVGFGARLATFTNWSLETDILVAHATLDFGSSRADMIVRERISFVFPFEKLSAFAGVSWFEYMGWNGTDIASNAGPVLDTVHQSGDFTFRTWPSLHAGVRF
ncbi:MAG: caspase family protein [Myxococcota bacterium]